MNTRILQLLQRNSRNRLPWLGLLAIVIAFGLGTRLRSLPFPPSFTGYLGDGLWALAVFVGYGLLFPGLSTTTGCDPGSGNLAAG